MRRLMPLLLFLALGGCQEKRIAAPPPRAEVAYAWVSFDSSGVRGSGASGLADRAASRALTIHDPVRVASVSKLIVALGVMRLVEEGRLDLDEDVSSYLGWQLRNPAFAETPITLRMLLSHRSSLQDAGEAYVIPLGKTVRGAVASSAVFDTQHPPGTYFRYSNLNFPIIASALELRTGERFDRLIHRLVMAPLGLDACFNWTMCSDAKIARAVTLYRPEGTVALDGLEGKRPTCPVFRTGTDCDLDNYALGSNGALFSPQGGLRVSMRDLALIGRLVLEGGKHGGGRFLREESVGAIIQPLWTFDGSNGDSSDGFYCAYGLASQSLPTGTQGCRDDLFGDGRRAVGHAGDAYGVRSGLWIDKRRRIGIAYFAANNGPEPVAGRSSFRAVEEFLARKIERAGR